jgi:predicted nucleic acid-binding protein
MMLVIDSNIIFSAIISPRGTTSELIFTKDLTLFSALTLKKELFEHKNELLKKSGLNETDFELLNIILFSKITFLDEEELDSFILKAKTICPDPDDVAFFAVALKKGIPLWSNDSLLKNQDFVKVINTKELVKLLV